ncbi:MULTISPECIES: hypothetical protein [unclassified Streptomyces]|uniref:hypothetical protein n=1 Tax=unclassified Streptomyces TaxID=2593676 RepID=UPI00381A9739
MRNMNPTTSANPTDPTAPSVTDAEETATEDAALDMVKKDEVAGEADGADGADGTAGADRAGEAFAEDDDLDPDGLDDSVKQPSGLGAAAAAVAAAALGVVALTGSWTGKVVAERETLIGQIKTSAGGSAAQQISEIYGDAWHSTALVNGLFALLALLAGVFALVRPAFGAPSADPQPGWVRAVATAGIALGVLGLVISAGMYFDLIVPLPTAGAAG